jgi:hypothetical protein
MLTAEGRKTGEAILRRVCVGRRICGIHFFAFPSLLLLDPALPGGEESFLRIESSWQFSPSGDLEWPDDADTIPEQPVEELCRIAVSLREHPIVAANLGTAVAHLLLRFAGGPALLITGCHPMYESWELSAGRDMVIALPGGGITYSE